MNKRSNIVDYDFVTLNFEDFEAKLILEADDVLFSKVFEKAKKKVLRKTNKTIKEGPESLKEFEVPKAFIPYLTTITKKTFENLWNIIAEDKINVLHYHISKTKFVKKGNMWQIHIYAEGVYSDDR